MWGPRPPQHLLELWVLGSQACEEGVAGEAQGLQPCTCTPSRPSTPQVTRQSVSHPTPVIRHPQTRLGQVAVTGQVALLKPGCEGLVNKAVQGPLSGENRISSSGVFQPSLLVGAAKAFLTLLAEAQIPAGCSRQLWALGCLGVPSCLRPTA